jgi:hypothetical protein
MNKKSTEPKTEIKQIPYKKGYKQKLEEKIQNDIKRVKKD